MISYTLTDEGITFFVDGIILFDCPAARIQKEPAAAIEALKILERYWQRKNEVLTLKGGDIENG